MQCHNCHVNVLDSDHFCEECGACLQPKTGCHQCGAALDQLDAEGFCQICGFQRKVGDPLVVTQQSAQLVGISDRGLKHHRNEDYLALDQVNQTAIMVVCDGVSSSHNPHLAAQIVAKTVCEQLAITIANQPAELALAQAIAAAQQAVSQLATPTDQDPPSTTLVAAVVQGAIATIGWLGDSRAYWITPSAAQLLTHDDSWFNQAVESGTMKAAEALHSPNAHAITRWLGADAADHCQPTIVTFTMLSSGYLLLCSDGLWNYTPNHPALLALIKPIFNSDIVTIAKSLVNHAIQRGGRDNITVALLSVSAC